MHAVTPDERIRQAFRELGTLTADQATRTAPALPPRRRRSTEPPRPHAGVARLAPAAAALVAAAVVLVVTVAVPRWSDGGPAVVATPPPPVPSSAPMTLSPSPATAAPAPTPAPPSPTTPVVTKAPDATPSSPHRSRPAAAETRSSGTPTADPTPASTTTTVPTPPWQQEYTSLVTSTRDPGSSVTTIRATVTGRTLSVWFWAAGAGTVPAGTSCLRVTTASGMSQVPLTHIALDVDEPRSRQGRMTFDAVPDGTVDLVYACDDSYPPARLGVLG